MENNAKLGSGGEAKTVIDNSSRTEQQSEQEHNPNLGSLTDNNGEQEEPQPPRQSYGRTPFTNLSQVDADLALARTLQDQERAYMMLRMNTVTDGSDYGSWETSSYLLDEEDDFGDPDEDETGDEGEEENNGSDLDDSMDAFDVHAQADDDVDDTPGVELDPASFSSDEAYARALQDAEERELAARLLALTGINDGELEDSEDHGGNSQDAWEEVDPDELSYEELIALGEVVGSENRGLSADGISSLPSVIYKAGSSQNGSNESCVICRLDYEDEETLTVLSCKHSYHSDCISNWLKINKVCPVCSTEVSTSGHS